jgi:hypothetical protein
MDPLLAARIAAQASALQGGVYSTGTVVGAAIGGAIALAVVMALAIRFRIVSAQINRDNMNAWGPKRASNPLKHVTREIQGEQVIVTSSSLTARTNRVVGMV